MPGLQHLRRDLLKSALSFYTDYLRSRAHDPSLRSSLAGVHFNAAKIYSEPGQREETEASYREALAHYEQLASARPEDEEAKDGLAESALGLGAHLFERKAIVLKGTEADEVAASAKTLLLRAVAILEPLVAANPEAISRREALARAYQTLGDFELSRTQVREALRSFLKARNIEATLVRDHPDTPAYQYGLGRNLGQIAECLCKLGQHPNETIVRPLAIEHARAAYEQAPQILAYGKLCGTLLARDGDNLSSQNRFEDSAKSYRQAMATQLKLSRENPAVTELPAAVFGTYSRLITRFKSKRPPSEILAFMREGAEAAESLPSQDPLVIFQGGAFLAMRADTPDPTQPADQDRARRERDAERAIDALKRAIQAGLPLPLLNNSSSMSNEAIPKLRLRDDFKAFLAERARAITPMTPAKPVDPASPATGPVQEGVATTLTTLAEVSKRERWK